MKKRDLVKAAKELNKVLGLDPKIDIKQEASTIEKLILKAADLIVPEDKISKETAELITDLKAFTEETPATEKDSADEEEEKEVSDTADEDNEDEDEDNEDEDEDDEDEEEDPPAKNTSKGKKTGKAEAQKPEKAQKASKPEKAEKSAESPGKKPAGPGIIATIVSLIEGSGKKGVTKEEILTALTKAFPDRKVESMKNTVNVQVPNRISKERFSIEKIDGDRYRKAAKA
jgi:cobalamin biosynthesis protein CobT